MTDFILQGSGNNAVSGSGSGIFFPPLYGNLFSLTNNVNLASAAANELYVVKIYNPVTITFTKATTVQPSGTTANMGVYYGIYNLSGILLTQIAFTTVNPGGSGVTLAGVITGATTIPSGTYYWGIACDTGATAGTVLGGVATSTSYFSATNLNGFGNCFKTNVLSGGLLPNITISAFTKTLGGHIASNTVGVVFLEP